jgi:hypothetical protein
MPFMGRMDAGQAVEAFADKTPEDSTFDLRHRALARVNGR